MPSLEADVAALQRLTALRGPMAVGTGPAIEQRQARADAAKTEIDRLRKLAENARAESARLAEMRP